MQTLNSLIRAALGDSVSLKNVKTGFGHDQSGRSCTVYSGKVKAFSLNDDGWAGGYEVQLSIHNAEATAALVARCKTPEILAAMVYQNESTDHMVCVDICDALIELHENKKFLDKRAKATLTGIVVGTENRFAAYNWKGKPTLSSLVQTPAGLKAVQTTYNTAKSKLKAGEQIWNTPEQLRALGLVL